MIDVNSINLICIFMIHEIWYIYNKMNLCTITPCSLSKSNVSKSGLCKYCYKLKKDYIEILLDSYIDDIRLTKKCEDENFCKCTFGNRFYSSSTISFDYFENHKVFEETLRGYYAPSSYDVLENGVVNNNLNKHCLRLCLVGMYVVHKMELNFPRTNNYYEQLYKSFLNIFLKNYTGGDIKTVDAFIAEFRKLDFEHFNPLNYSSDLGKLVCLSVNCYSEILKDELDIVSIRSDFSEQIIETIKSVSPNQNLSGNNNQKGTYSKNLGILKNLINNKP